MSDEFLHGIYTVESTTGSLAVTDVASSVIGIFGTSEKSRADAAQSHHQLR
ncbi:hypothetical protein [Vibrio parahaemolyticus]|uniref:hypothetical protein n=1 Tax=Vibrio parahaemolyticus TaxID=670 RepID=UPI00214CDE5C|nr:hypothetical protein [Vibrio parahaemolyticus]